MHLIGVVKCSTYLLSSVHGPYFVRSIMVDGLRIVAHETDINEESMFIYQWFLQHQPLIAAQLTGNAL